MADLPHVAKAKRRFAGKLGLDSGPVPLRTWMKPTQASVGEANKGAAEEQAEQAERKNAR